MAMAQAVYHPKDAIAFTTSTTFKIGMAGLAVSAIQNALKRENIGAMGILTRTGGTIVTFASVGAAYSFTQVATANLREKDDHWNTTIGGFFGGAVGGLRHRKLTAVFGLGAALATALGVFDYTGGSLTGPRRDPDEDIIAKKEAMRNNKRTSIQETLDQIGEGRGIYGPGYRERRKERLKEKYGIDVPV